MLNFAQMKNLLLSLFLIFCWALASTQTTIDFQEDGQDRLYIRLYAHVDYNKKIEGNINQVGKLDVHRLVTLFGYQFGKNTQFVSEIEVEHVKDIFVEQAFVKHRIKRGINLKAGLMLVPMGFVNEMHEPTFFYSVERPLLDKVIIPTTWREIGIGFSGLIYNLDLKYQIYLMNNPLGYNNEARISAAQGFRAARQKGAESIINTFPGLASQVEYFGLADAKVGLSVYHGKTNSTLYNGEELTVQRQAAIDSSSVLLSMITLHGSYNKKQWVLRGQYTFANYKNTGAYNAFSGSDVPNSMHGFYLTVAYDFIKSDMVSLEPYVRYSYLDNHLDVNKELTRDDALRQNIYTIGVNYKPHPGVVFKLDGQAIRKANGHQFNTVNAGVGVWF